MSFEQELIAEVKEHECLYNMRLPDYRRVEEKEKIWTTISIKLGREKRLCRQRWKSLRDRFRKEVTDRECDKIRKPWPYYNSMSFLKREECWKKNGVDFDLPDIKSEASDVVVEPSIDQLEYPESPMFSEANISLEKPKISSFNENRHQCNCTISKSSHYLEHDLNFTSVIKKSPIARFLEIIAEQIDTGNISQLKMLRFQQSVLEAAYEATKKESN